MLLILSHGFPLKPTVTCLYSSSGRILIRSLCYQSTARPPPLRFLLVSLLLYRLPHNHYIRNRS